MDYQKESEMFDQAAEYYDQFRPSYPKKIIQVLVEKAGLTLTSRTLEIGAGSGKATEQFLEYGFSIHCVEPGENLVQNGKIKFRNFPQISYECGRFENLEARENQFDAIISAQAFHWIPQPIGYQKCAEFLRKEGYLALIWNMYLYDECKEHLELLELSRKYGGFADFVNEQEAENRIDGISQRIEGSGLFEKPDVYIEKWDKVYTLDDYYGFVQTGNRFLQQSDQQKEQIYSDLKFHFDQYNGTITRPYWTVLYLSKVSK